MNGIRYAVAAGVASALLFAAVSPAAADHHRGQSRGALFLIVK